jgi:hypothetical protein
MMMIIALMILMILMIVVLVILSHLVDDGQLAYRSCLFGVSSLPYPPPRTLFRLLTKSSRLVDSKIDHIEVVIIVIVGVIWRVWVRMGSFWVGIWLNLTEWKSPEVIISHHDE